MTQNTVDKYLDDILLETVYTVAHEETLQEMGLSPREVRKEEEEEGAVRRASASESQDSGREAGNWQERSLVKQKMKATQRMKDLLLLTAEIMNLSTSPKVNFLKNATQDL